MYNLTRQNPIISAFTATLATAIMLSAAYLLLEPTSMYAAADTDIFTVTQEIGAEISFATNSGNITMAGTAIGGATGGTRFGSTTVAVTTNNASGYTLGIEFESSNGMELETGADFIDYYASSSPDYDMGLGSNTSGFAYSVSSTNQVAAFDNTGSACGSGSIKSIDNCYVMQGTPTSASTIVSSGASATAEETIIGFQVIVAAGSGLANGFYKATTTLTATTI